MAVLPWAISDLASSGYVSLVHLDLLALCQVHQWEQALKAEHASALPFEVTVLSFLCTHPGTCTLS